MMKNYSYLAVKLIFMPAISFQPELDQFIQTLQSNKQKWVELPIADKVKMLENIRENLGIHAQKWVDLSVQNKQIDPQSPIVGEEWASGPWATVAGVNAYVDTLNAIQKGTIKKLIKKIQKRPDGQLKLKVFPTNFYDVLLFNQIEGEVWMQKSVNEQNLADNMAVFYKQKSPKGKVSLILGAGNINSIPPLDLLYNLIVKGEVVLLKMNPVNDYLTPVFNQVFEPFIKHGFLRITSGDATVGKYLTSHPDIECIHITGSERTHDIIVYGPGEEGRIRKENKNPVLDASKPITSELGGISPMIVVPGPWTKADIIYQAKNIVTAKLHNGGHNCVASQVLILPKSWEHSEELLKTVHDLMKDVPYRPAYYPGTEGRQKALMEAYPQAEELVGDIPRTIVTGLLSDSKNEYAFNTEFFGAMYAQTDIEGATPRTYFKNAVKFCNEKLHGKLGATILIHPQTMKEMGAEFERGIADMKYGAIGVNIWNGVVFLLAQCTWGAYPGHTYDDIQSGIGIVHNSLMLENVEKSVLYGPFRGLPRAWTLAPPSPPWFVTNRTAATTLERLTKFAVHPSVAKLPGIFASALTGG